MDSLEKACLKVTSPSGKTIVISKIALFDVKLSEKVNATLRRFVKGTVLWETVDFVSQMFDKVKGGDSGACRNEECYDHSGYGGMNAGIQQGVPDKCSDDDIEHLGYDVASVADG